MTDEPRRSPPRISAPEEGRSDELFAKPQEPNIHAFSVPKEYLQDPAIYYRPRELDIHSNHCRRRGCQLFRGHRKTVPCGQRPWSCKFSRHKAMPNEPGVLTRICIRCGYKWLSYDRSDWQLYQRNLDRDESPPARDALGDAVEPRDVD